jgi:hypothetical protein
VKGMVINMPCVKFKYQDEKFVYQLLIDAVNKLCKAKGKNCLCTSGYRSEEKQKIINADSLRSRKSQGAYQLANGAVYTPDGKCWASAYGCSFHNYCIAMDITDDWFLKLNNDELKKYNLKKSVSYEPWHVTLIGLVGISQKEKEAIRDIVLNGKNNTEKDNRDITVKEFQSTMGLIADGVAGDKTKAKAKEVLQVCQEILGCNYSTAESAIKGCMSEPSTWLAKLDEISHLDDFTMNIVNKMSGKK